MNQTRNKTRCRASLKLLVVTAMALGVAGSQAYGDGTLPLGDGTLPLRLPSDGTLPLMLTGPAMPIPNRPDLNNGDATLRIERANKRAVMVGRNPIAAGCSLAGEEITAHNANGSIVVAGVRLQVRRICYNHQNKQVEFLATRGVGEREIKLSFIGLLNNPEPESVAGRMRLTGQQSGRYHVQLQR